MESRTLVTVNGDGAIAHDLEALSSVVEASPLQVIDEEEFEAASSKDDMILLSISNEELDIHLSFWATRDQDEEMGRLMDKGMSQREAMKIVFPPKNKKLTIEK